MVDLEEALVEELWCRWVETELWAKGTVVVEMLLLTAHKVLAVAVLVR
jgi:hypothetical protein